MYDAASADVIYHRLWKPTIIAVYQMIVGAILPAISH